MKRSYLFRSCAAGCCGIFLLSLVLAGCTPTATSSSSSSVSSQALSEVPASEAIPSGEDDTTPAPNVDDTENGFSGISAPANAFAGSLGWGPGTAGTSLKSVAAAASMLDWADENSAANRSSDALRDSLSQWFDSLEQVDQENFAEVWPLIEESAQRILDDPKAVQEELSDAGVQEIPSCSEEDWSAVAGVLNAIVPAPQQ